MSRGYSTHQQRPQFGSVARKMHGLSIGILSTLGTCLLSWYLAYDTVTCNVIHAGSTSVNGYYSAVGGIYFRRGYEISCFPDVFEIFSLRKNTNSEATIALTKHSWAIFATLRKEMLYRNNPEHPDEYIYNPPSTGWTIVDGGKGPAPTVAGCRGSLQDSPPLPSSEVSNMGQLLQRPVTVFLLGIIFYFAYYLWSNRTEVSSVSYSYDAIVNQGEYWRMVTSSFSHFDAWHLLFNTMSLYQLGELETTYGSVPFAFLNADLVFITMGICILFSYIMIAKFGRVDQTYQQAVGFSCVLFAWMVAASVRMKEYCPIFLFPSLCFKTYNIPNPLISYNFGPKSGFPVNIGPVILLVITKVIIPKSSFLGHLSGIVIGYPLAWNALNWLTPPLAFALVAVFVTYQKKLYPMNFPGYELTPDLADQGSAFQINRYLRLRWAVFVSACLSVLCVFYLGPWQLLPRVVLVLVSWSAVQGRRCEWLSTSRSVHEDCLYVLYISAVGSAVAMLYDISTLGASLAAVDLLMGCGLPVHQVYTGLALMSASAVLEAMLLVLTVACINDIPLSQPVMLLFRLDAASLQRDVKVLGLRCLPCCRADSDDGHMTTRHVFDTPGRRAAPESSTREVSRLLTEAPSSSSSYSDIVTPSSSTIDFKSIVGLKIAKTLPFPKLPSTRTGDGTIV